MEYISSDTNVWIDFSVVNELELPFRLPYSYIMSKDAVENELLSPPHLNKRLSVLGLISVDLSEAEFYLAFELNKKYIRLSKYDSAALAIAKTREIVLLTGDGPLRRAAIAEGVDVMGTIGVLDQLLEKSLIEIDKYLYCMEKLLEENGGKVRLPKNELQKRIRQYGSQQTE